MTAMPRKPHKPEEIVAIRRLVDVSVSQEKTVADAVRAIGVTEATRQIRRSDSLNWLRRCSMQARWRASLSSFRVQERRRHPGPSRTPAFLPT
jgi:hypothetical protein